MTCWGFSVSSLWQESGLWINKLNLQPLKLDHYSCSSLSHSTRDSRSRPCPSVNINCPRHLQWLFALVFPLKPLCAVDPHISCATQSMIAGFSNLAFWSITQAKQIHLSATGNCGVLGRKLETFCHTAQGKCEIYILSAFRKTIRSQIFECIQVGNFDSPWHNISPSSYFQFLHLISCVLLLVILFPSPMHPSWLLHEKSYSCKPRHKEWWDHCALKFPWPYQFSTNGPVPLPTAMSYIYTVFLPHLSSFSYNKGG